MFLKISLCLTILVLLWAVLIYGPKQRSLGSKESLIKTDEITKKVAKGLSDEAESFRFKHDLCVDTGGLFNYVSAECER